MIDKPHRETKYPFDAWRLSPAYKASKVVIVEAWAYRYYKTATGSCHYAKDLYESRELAIADGFNLIETAQARATKQQANIKQRAATLRRQAGET